MKTVNYISHLLENNIEDVKASILYFDKINIIEQAQLRPGPTIPITDENGKVIMDAEIGFPFTNTLFKQHLKELENEGLIKYLYNVGGSPYKIQNPVVLGRNEEINLLIMKNLDAIGDFREISRTEQIGKAPLIQYNVDFNSEGQYLIDNLFNDVQEKHIPIHLMIYLGKLLVNFIKQYENGKDILSSSPYLNSMLHRLEQTEDFKKTREAFRSEFQVVPNFAFESIRINLPNLGKFPTQEILNFREKSKDELLAFQAKMEEITFDFLKNYEYSEIIKYAQKIVDLKVSPLVKDIGNSLNRSNSKLMLDLINEAKDLKSYSPMLLTLSSNISSTFALLVSAGLISLKTGLEKYNANKEAKKDGIYYLYKAQQHFS